MLIFVREHPKNAIINCFIAQNLGNKAKPRDHDPPGYFRSQMYPGYEIGFLDAEIRYMENVHRRCSLTETNQIIIRVYKHLWYSGVCKVKP